MQQLQEFVLSRCNLLHQPLQILQPHIADLVLLYIEASGNDRKISVGWICSNDDQLVGLTLVILEGEHLRLDHHIPLCVRKRIHELLDEGDPRLVRLLVREVDFPEGVEVCHFPKNRIVISPEFGNEDLPEVLPILLVIIGILHLQGLFQRLEIDDTLLEKCISYFIGYVYFGHGCAPQLRRMFGRISTSVSR